jgi:hypothetical protein
MTIRTPVESPGKIGRRSGNRPSAAVICCPGCFHFRRGQAARNNVRLLGEIGQVNGRKGNRSTNVVAEDLLEGVLAV